MKDFKLYSIDNDFCRIYYKIANAAGQILLYCLQDEGKHYGGVICYRCSSQGEPDYSITYAKNRFEVPEGNSDIEKVVREYLTKDDNDEILQIL